MIKHAIDLLQFSRSLPLTLFFPLLARLQLTIYIVDLLLDFVSLSETHKQISRVELTQSHFKYTIWLKGDSDICILHLPYLRVIFVSFQPAV